MKMSLLSMHTSFLLLWSVLLFLSGAVGAKGPNQKRSLGSSEWNDQSFIDGDGDKDMTAYSYVTDLFKTMQLSTIRISEEQRRRRHLQDTSNYLDFTKLLDPTYVDEDDFYAMVGSVIQQIKTMINGNAVEGGPLLINSLAQGLFTSNNATEDGAPFKVRWELPNGGYQLDLPGMNPVTMIAVVVGGLDTFNMVNILNPTEGDPQTIQNAVGLDVLTLDLEIMEMTGDNGETSNTVIGLSFQDVDISFPLVLAVDRTALAEFPVGALLFFKYLLPCLNVVVDTIEIDSLDMEFGTIDRPTTSSPSPSAVFQLISTVFVTLPGTVPAFFDSILRPIVNNMVQNNTDSNSVSCPSSTNVTTSAEEGFVDFYEFFQQGLPSILKSFLESQILAVDLNTGLSVANTMFIDPWTFNQSGVEGMLMLGNESAPLVDFNSGISIGGLEADIQLHVDSVKFGNVNTLTEPLEVLETMASDPYLLNNTATVGLNLEDRPLRLSAGVFLSIDTAGTLLINYTWMSVLESRNLLFPTMFHREWKDCQ